MSIGQWLRIGQDGTGDARGASRKLRILMLAKTYRTVHAGILTLVSLALTVLVAKGFLGWKFSRRQAAIDPR